jgi:hypothetical protein
MHSRPARSHTPDFASVDPALRCRCHAALHPHLTATSPRSRARGGGWGDVHRPPPTGSSPPSRLPTALDGSMPAPRRPSLPPAAASLGYGAAVGDSLPLQRDARRHPRWRRGAAAPPCTVLVAVALPAPAAAKAVRIALRRPVRTCPPCPRPSAVIWTLASPKQPRPHGIAQVSSDSWLSGAAHSSSVPGTRLFRPALLYHPPFPRLFVRHAKWPDGITIKSLDHG